MNFDQPSLSRIFRTDYLAFFALVYPIGTWVFFFLGHKGTAAEFFIISGLTTGTAAPILLWRIYTINKLFEIGVETPAVITKISGYRGSRRVEYTYRFQNIMYTSRSLLYSSDRVRELERRQEVIVLVDPNKPKRALIKKLYL